MIGDLYLILKKFIKQHFLCIHEYKIVRNPMDLRSYGEYAICSKCGKRTNNIDLAKRE